MTHPFPKHVLVLRDPIRQETTTAAGIIVQHDQKKREDMHVILRWGTVIEMGEECAVKDLTGFRVAYNPFDAYEVPSDRLEDTDIHEVVKITGVMVYEPPKVIPTASEAPTP
jgi:co-chaperonin GroES (HSP10)